MCNQIFSGDSFYLGSMFVDALLNFDRRMCKIYTKWAYGFVKCYNIKIKYIYLNFRFHASVAIIHIINLFDVFYSLYDNY